MKWQSYKAHDVLWGPQHTTRPTACYEVHKVLQSEKATKHTASNEAHNMQQNPRQSTTLTKWHIYKLIICYKVTELRGPGYATKLMKWQNYKAHGEVRDSWYATMLTKWQRYTDYSKLRGWQSDKVTRYIESYKVTNLWSTRPATR